MGALTGRFELPKPAGARPRSVAFPCASQVRGLLPARCEAVLPTVGADVRFEFVTDEGGRFCESSRCRGVMLDVLGMLPGRMFVVGMFPGRLFAVGALCDGAFGETAR